MKLYNSTYRVRVVDRTRYYLVEYMMQGWFKRWVSLKHQYVDHRFNEPPISRYKRVLFNQKEAIETLDKIRTVEKLERYLTEHTQEIHDLFDELDLDRKEGNKCSPT